VTERRYRIRHRTSYRYGTPMADGYTVVHLLARSTPWQQVWSSQIDVDPEPAEFDEFTDLFGNRVVQFGVHRAHTALVVEANSEVLVTARPTLGSSEPWEQVVASLHAMRGTEALSIGPFLARSHFVDLAADGAELRRLAEASFPAGRGVIDGCRDLCAALHRSFGFDPTATDVSTPLGVVLEQRRGVCQDFAHLAVGCLRSMGLAARYVSGYLETEPPPGQERLIGADLSHAWCSVWTPSDGWVDFDPTNDHLPTQHHVTLGWGRDFADVSPVRGVVIGPASSQDLEVSVDVVGM